VNEEDKEFESSSLIIPMVWMVPFWRVVFV